MNFILTIVLFVSVTVHIVVGTISNPLYNSDDENSHSLNYTNSLSRESNSLKEQSYGSLKKENSKKHSHKNSNKHVPILENGKKWNGVNEKPVPKPNPCSINNYKGIWTGFYHTQYHYNHYSLFKTKIRDHINLIRGYHRVETLRENAELDRLAQEHANQMAKQKKLFYVSSTYYGILVWASYYPAASVMVSKWYDERSRYNFLLNSPKPGTQHLTQMLWKNTKSVGIGIARDCDFLYAALYFYPKGNIRGQYRTNVFNKRSNCFGRK